MFNFLVKTGRQDKDNKNNEANIEEKIDNIDLE